MPFKPRIIRFDDEHAGVSAPASGCTFAPAIGNIAAPVEAPATDPVHDTVRGLELDTIRDWDFDDALLADPKMQCLARQLSDDAAALAKRYPAEGWEPPVMATECGDADKVTPRRALAADVLATFLGERVWQRLLGVSVAAAACLIVALGPQLLGPHSVDSGSSTDSSAAPAVNTATETNFVTLPPQQPKYVDGDAAIWGSDLVDDSQFGEPPFGNEVPRDPTLEAPPIPGHDALRELLPADSHDYCEVSM